MKRVLSTLVSALTLMMGPVANASTPAIPPLECVFDVECDHHALTGRSAQQHGVRGESSLFDGAMEDTQLQATLETLRHAPLVTPSLARCHFNSRHIFQNRLRR